MGEYIMFNTNNMMKINLFFSPKSTFTNKKFEASNTIKAQFGRELAELTIIDDIMEFGLMATALVKNEAGALNLLLNNHTLFQAVLIISSQDNESFTYKLEPYIFDIVEIRPVTFDNDINQYYEFVLESELSFIARTHHWVSVLKFDQAIKTSGSYEAVYECILNYFKRFISVSSNKQFYLEKAIHFVDPAPDTHELVEATLKKIPGDSTIYDALRIIGQDACTSVWAEADMEKEFQMFSQGAVYVPMFFRDEYADLHNFYARVYEGKERDDATGTGTGTATDANTTGTADNAASGTNAPAATGESTPPAANPVTPQGGGTPANNNVNVSTGNMASASLKTAKIAKAALGSITSMYGGQVESANVTATPAAPTTASQPAQTQQQPSSTPGNPVNSASASQATQSSAGLTSADPATAVNTGGNTQAQGVAAVSDSSAQPALGDNGQDIASPTVSAAISSADYLKSTLGDDKNLPLYERIANDKPSEVQQAISGTKVPIAETYMVRRHYYLRNMYMPFDLAFKSDQASIIYESFNPVCINSDKGNGKLDSSEEKYKPLLGYATTSFDNYIAYPIDNNASSTFWKNMIFCYVKGTGTGSSLVYFDWIYRYYHYNFLKTHKHKDGKFLNIVPAFYRLQSSLKDAVKKANDKVKSELESNYKDFCELNSNLFILDSEAPAKEIQFHIGKMLASFVLLNSSIEFSVPGKLFRRPNEIIKVNKSSSTADTENDSNDIDITSVDMNNIYTDINNTNTTMLYVRRITHSFKGNEYLNKIYGNRIYDIR